MKADRMITDVTFFFQDELTDEGWPYDYVMLLSSFRMS